MDNDCDLTPDDAMEQAVFTAQHYLNQSYEWLVKDGYEEWTVRDAIELAKVMAADFHTSMTCIKLQEIRDAIRDVAQSR